MGFFTPIKRMEDSTAHTVNLYFYVGLGKGIYLFFLLLIQQSQRKSPIKYRLPITTTAERKANKTTIIF